MISFTERLKTFEATGTLVKASSPRPLTWDDIVGNARAIEQIREGLFTAKQTDQPLPHLLLFGPSGTGKTTLAKLIARELGGIFIETTASTCETPADMIRYLWTLNTGALQTKRPSTLFMDEIHMLGQAKGRQAIDQESIFPLLEDWVFAHNLIRKTVEDANGKTWILTANDIDVWPFTLVGATTEPGMLSPAILRRFPLQIQLEPYTQADMTQIILGSARRLDWPTTEGAAVSLARFGRRNPGVANNLLTVAHNRAAATGRETITEEVVEEIIERMKLCPLGLTETDVKVLRVLYDRMPRGMGMAEICRAIGISQSQFATMIEPYLRLLGFIETLSRRVIKAAGIRYLAQVGQIDTSRPDVRAALGDSS